MIGFQEKLQSYLIDLFSPFKTEKDWQELCDKSDSEIDELLNKASLDLSSIVLEESPNDLKTARKKKDQFEQNLNSLWSLPLDYLETTIWVAHEVGKQANKEYRKTATETEDYVLESLTRLHAKACQTSLAILTLLKSGFADDAYARWRSLHEISVIGSFIKENGQELAEKYLLHEPIQQYKTMLAQNDVHGRNNESEIPQEDIDSLKQQRDLLLERFGKDFKNDYGWAAGILGNPRPTIRDIEKKVRLDHFRPYYKLASNNVHANSHGLFFRMGTIPGREDVLLSGPSQAGLAGPGHATAISLMQITLTLLLIKPSTITSIIAFTLIILSRRTGDAFLQVHKELEPDETPESVNN